MLDDLLLVNDPCIKPLGGVTVLQFLPTASLVSMPIPSGLSLTGTISLKAGARWYTLEVVESTGYYEETPRDTNSGTLYEIRTGGFYADDSLETLEKLERMKQYYYLVRVKDRDGRWRIVGNAKETMKLTKREYSSTTMETRRGFLIEFSAAFTRPGLIDNRS